MNIVMQNKKLASAIIVGIALAVFLVFIVILNTAEIQPPDPVDVEDSRIHEDVIITNKDLRGIVSLVRNGFVLTSDKDPIISITMPVDEKNINVFAGNPDKNGKKYTLQKKGDKWTLLSENKIIF